MADLKISQLTGATTPLAGTEVLPVVQSGVTKQVSVANLTAGRVVSANGVAFPAVQVASSDPNTLDDYEEGQWTCTLKGSISDPTTPVTRTATYTKVGRLVQFHVAFVNVNTTGASGAITFTGLPFTSANNNNHMVTAGVFQGATFSNNVASYVLGNGTTIELKSLVSNGSWTDVTHNAGAGAYFWISGVYFVG